MAKKKTIMREVLTCFIVFAILASVMPVPVFAMNSSNNATEASNHSNDLEKSFILPLVSNDTGESVSALSCDVYVKIDDDTCVGYEVYVDGVYQFTEGQSGTPDGYCAFYVSAGTHKFELRKNGCTTSKSWYCQCGTVYIWVSMPDNWCDGGNHGEVRENEIKFTGTAIKYYESHSQFHYWVVRVDKIISGPQPCKDQLDVCIWDYEIPNPWGSVDQNLKEGDQVEVYGTYYEYDGICSASLYGSTDYYIKKIGDIVCEVYVIIDDDTCVGYEVYVDGVYQFTEGQDGTPDGYCAFYVTPGTHKFELRKNGCSVSKSWYCQCGTYYSWVSMNDMDPHWCDSHQQKKEVTFSGIVTGTSPEGLFGAGHWYVDVDEWISGSLPCDEIDVAIGIYPPMGSCDEDINKGDNVEAYGVVDPWGGSECTVGLNGESYYIKKIESCGKILEYAISDGTYPLPMTVMAHMKYKNYMKSPTKFKGVFLVKNQRTDKIYSCSKEQITNIDDSFGYGKGNSLQIRFEDEVEDIGVYDAKLELRNFYTDELCDETEWLEDQFKIEASGATGIDYKFDEYGVIQQAYDAEYALNMAFPSMGQIRKSYIDLIPYSEAAKGSTESIFIGVNNGEITQYSPQENAILSADKGTITWQDVPISDDYHAELFYEAEFVHPQEIAIEIIPSDTEIKAEIKNIADYPAYNLIVLYPEKPGGQEETLWTNWHYGIVDLLAEGEKKTLVLSDGLPPETVKATLYDYNTHGLDDAGLDSTQHRNDWINEWIDEWLGRNNKPFVARSSVIYRIPQELYGQYFGSSFPPCLQCWPKQGMVRVGLVELYDLPAGTQPKTIYVDDDFVDDPPNHKWDTIQEGVDDAEDGDTVLVYSGTYNENVDVTKSLTIKSTSGNPKDTIVQAQNPDDPTFEVTADDVTISGFTVDGGLGSNGLYLNSVKNCEISNNNCSGHWAIVLGDSSNNAIIGNNCSNNDVGISLWNSNTNALTGNNVTSNYIGIEIGSSSNNILTENTLLKNNWNGVYLQGTSSNNVLYHNNFISNSASDMGTLNQWDNGYPSGGNYWSDYDDKSEGAIDEKSGPNQDQPGSDGFADTPYDVPGSAGAEDNYPLMDYTPFPLEDWPMFRHDPTHTGYTTEEISLTDLSRIWTFKTENVVKSSPAVANGKVFVGSLDHKIYAIDESNGEEIWSHLSKDKIISSPAVADGKVFVGSYTGHLYAFNENDGTNAWGSIPQLEGRIFSSPVVAYGMVFVGTAVDVDGNVDVDGKIYALDENTGAIKWDLTFAGTPIYSSPAVADGMVFFGSDNYPSPTGTIYCLNAYTKEEIWSYETGGGIVSSPTVVDGKVFVGSNDGSIYAFNEHDTNGDKQGDIIWRYDTPYGGHVSSSSAVANGRVFVGCCDGYIYCLHAEKQGGSSQLIWSTKIGGGTKLSCQMFSSPAVVNGLVFVGSDDNKICALDSNGNILWTYTTGGPVSSSPAVADGKVFVGSEDHKIYAFGSLSTITKKLTANKDAYVDTLHPDRNYGSEDKLAVIDWSTHTVRSYIEFDLSSIPDGYVIQDAKLELFYDGCDSFGSEIGAYKVTSNWDEALITWNNQPNFDSTLIDVITLGCDSGKVGDFVSWDITDIVQKWVDSSVPNHGILVKTTEEIGTENFDIFCSSEYSDPARHPKLIINSEEPLSVHNIDTGEDFAKIQDAIDDSGTSPGDTITADPGTYTENVKVTKSLTIKSTSGNPKDTFVQAQNPDDPVFEVAADDVTISGFTVDGGLGSNGIYLNSVKNCEISNNNCSGHWAIVLGDSSNNAIISNNCSNNDVGISLWNSNNNALTGNNVTSNYIGIEIGSSSGNILTENTLRKNNWNGVYLQGTSSNNELYHNNFISNSASDMGTLNQWDNGYPSGGNYWGGYDDESEGAIDEKSGPNQDQPGSDGIADTAYEIPGGVGARDNYPLMEPWGQEQDKTEYWAVLVGGEFDPETGAGVEFSNDVITLKNVLMSDYNFDTNHLKCLIDEDSTRGNIEEAINWMGDKADENDVCLFFFSGHGLPSTDDPHGDPVCICVKNEDGDLDFIDDTELEMWFEEYETNNLLIIFGSCLSGGMISNLEGSGRAILTCAEDHHQNCKSHHLCFPDHGEFSFYIIQGLYGAADHDNDDSISPNELFSYVHSQVERSSPAPSIESSFVFTKIPSSLQQKINEASPGAIIQLDDKVYREHLIIDKPLTLEGHNTVFDSQQLPGCIHIFGTSDVELRGIEFKGYEYGVFIESSSHCILKNDKFSGVPLVLFKSNENEIVESSITDCGDSEDIGIRLVHSSENVINRNRIESNYWGAYLFDGSNGNVIKNNQFLNIGFSLLLFSSSNNLIFHNDFLGENAAIYSTLMINQWNNDYPSGGNYWSEIDPQDRADKCHGPDHPQKEEGKDGIWDTPYEISDRPHIIDYYPFVDKSGWQIQIDGICNPIELILTDPDGLIISKEENGIPDATYTEHDLDGDDDLDDSIIISDRKMGDYKITVIPEPDAEPTDTYTLKVSIGDTTTVLAENIPISKIPAEPYIFNSCMNQSPSAPFSYTPENPVANQEITINASASYDPEGHITNYKWDFGDGSCGTGKVVTHTYSNPGTYSVTLTVEDDEGNTNANTQVVEVKDISPTRDIPISTAEISQLRPTIAYNRANNEYLVTWDDKRSGSEREIYAQRLSGANNLLGSNFPIALSSGTDIEEVNPFVAYNPTANEYLIVWNEKSGYHNLYYIYAQRVSNTGSLLGDKITVSSGDVRVRKFYPTVAYNPANNEYFVVWYGQDVEGQPYRIYGQRLSSSGSLLSSNFAIGEDIGKDNYQYYPQIAYNSHSNDYLVVWEDMRNGGEKDIYAQKVSGSGSLSGSNYCICNAANAQEAPSVAYNSADNQYLVTWQDSRTGSNADIYAQMISGTGNVLGNEIAVRVGGGTSLTPSVTYNSKFNVYFVAWGENDDIFAQEITNDSALSGSGVVICDAVANQGEPSVAYNSANNQYFITWQDYRNSNYDIYGASVQPSQLNNPPNKPSNPSPSAGATDVSITTDLSWTGGDPDIGDTVTYDVYFGTSTSPPLVANDQSGTTYDPGTLSKNTKYYWKIIATDNHGASTTGDLWDFNTGTDQQLIFQSTDNAVPITIDGTSQSSPYTTSWTSGSVHSVNALSEFIAQPDCLNYVFTGWTGAITLSCTLLPPTLSPGTYAANYKKQYYLTVDTEPQGIATISGEGWYDEGAMATTGNAQKEVTVGDEKYPFETWKVDGSPVSLPFDWVQLKMDDCHTVTASYQYGDWKYHEEITIKENSGNTLIDYQVLISLNPSNFPNEAKSDGADIRFYDETKTELNYWIAEWDYSSKTAKIWVKVPIILTNGEAKINMYYGNPSASSQSNGDATFEFFDDFEDGSIDTGKWTTATTGFGAFVTENSGEINIHTDAISNTTADLISQNSYGPDVAIMFQASISAGQWLDHKGLGFLSTNVGNDWDQVGDSVHWRGQDDDLYASNKYSDSSTNTVIEDGYFSGYRTWEIAWLSSEIRYYANGILKATHTTNVPSVGITPRFSFKTYTTAPANPLDVFVDYVYVRKYADPEPTITTEGA